MSVLQDRGVTMALCHTILISGLRLMRSLLSGTLLVVEEEEKKDMVNFILGLKTFVQK